MGKTMEKDPKCISETFHTAPPIPVAESWKGGLVC